MNKTPSIEEFVNAEFSVTPGFHIADEPTIIVENAVADEPFYYEISVKAWEELDSKATENDDATDEFIEKSLETKNELDESYGILL